MTRRAQILKDVLAVMKNHGLLEKEPAVPRELKSKVEYWAENFVDEVVGEAQDYGVLPRQPRG